MLFEVGTLKASGALNEWSFGHVRRAVFSPDGKMLVVLSDGGWLTAWDTTT
jgi:hypothetical protein